MALAERRAQAVWQGSLTHGSGEVTSGTGAFGPLSVTWASRTERPDGKTSPEELIAAAHASCYAMALSHTLSQQGNEPERLTIDAVCSLERADGGIKISSVNLSVRGRVAGMDQVAFEKAARDAEKGCPVSNALRNNVQITVDARLES